MLQRSQIQYQPAFNTAVSGDVVPPATDGQRQAAAPDGIQHGVNVGYRSGADDGAWPEIDHAVPYPPGFVVQGIIRLDQGTRQPGAQPVQRLLYFRFPVGVMDCGHHQCFR